METKTISTGLAFSKVLRSFQTGGVTFSDVLNQVKDDLEAGASPSDLLEILRRREAVEPLPNQARNTLLKLLGAGAAAASGETDSIADEPAIPKTAASPVVAAPAIASAPAVVPAATAPVAAPAIVAAPAVIRAAAAPVVAPAVIAAPLVVAPAVIAATPATAAVAPAIVAAPAVTVVVAPAAPAVTKRVQARTPTPPKPLVPPKPLEELPPRFEPASSDRIDAATAVPTPTVGDLVQGRYHLLELIGEGAQSRVYKAIDSGRSEQLSADKYIAVKVLTRPVSDSTEIFAELQRSVANVTRLIHPNIVRTFDCASDGSTVFVTMEYVAGKSLFARLKEANPSVRNDANFVIASIADALDYAHGQNIVHGALKPKNVMLTEAGGLKVADFGLANLTAPKTAQQRREAAQAGLTAAARLRYSSPQLGARQSPEPVDDVYSLACLAYELVTGVHPFDDGNGAQTLKFPPPMRDGLSETQYAALVNAMQFERRHRPPSIKMFMLEFGGAKQRRSWTIPAISVAAVAILLIVGWFSIRPSLRTASTISHPAEPLSTSAKTPGAHALIEPIDSTASLAKPGSVIRDCQTCPVMAVLPTGRFKQGSANGDDTSLSYEKPQHWVVMSRTIAVAVNDVTVGDFQEFIRATSRDMRGCDTYDGDWRPHEKASWADPGFAQGPNHPVTCVSWSDATAYARWLSNKSGHKYRLPSASEWEYAARAGTQTARPWGIAASEACNEANVADRSAARQYPGWNVFACDDGFVNTAPVGSYKANAFGLKDTLGNVFEWTQDCWHPDYSHAPIDGSARLDGDCTEHELRGGSWFSAPPAVRLSYRNHFSTGYRTSSVGFRLVRDLAS